MNIQRDDNSNIQSWVCPKCGQLTNEYPALSRIDNKTNICPKCGMTEALSDAVKHGLIKEQ